MVIVKQSYDRYLESTGSKKLPNYGTSNLIRRYSRSKKLFRQYPLLASFHKIIDGALLGLLVTLFFMSAISLHAQYLWTVSFDRLENTRDLIHKLKESITILESHFLASKSLPQSLVGTTTSHLIYLDKPKIDRYFFKLRGRKLKPFYRLVSFPVKHGY